MAHLRKRHLQPLLKQSLKFSPLVGIFGHRQVGKTTLATELSTSYCTLDTPSTLDLALNDAESLLQKSKGHPFAIDECQYAPPLFPALKEWVRTHKSPGQFLLTGSVRFSSRKAIRESLTGRIINWELLPLDLSESNSEKLPNTIPRILSAKSLDFELKNAYYFKEHTLAQVLDQGGLPGIFAIRNHTIRAQRFETQLNTILERDLKLIYETPLSYQTLRNLAVQLSLMQGKPLEWQNLGRQTRISVPTLKRILSALQSIFFIRLIPTEGSEKKPVIFLEDQGEASFLSSGLYDASTNMVRFLFSQLRHQVHYRPELNAKIFQLRNRGGAYVPLCFSQGKNTVGIIPLVYENPETSALQTARSFQKQYPGSKVLFVHEGKSDKLITSTIRSLPVGKLF